MAEVHPRRTIREAVVALLIAANTDAGHDVFPSREVPWRSIELPGISVYTPEEDSERLHVRGPLDRHVVVVVHAVTRLSEGIDDELDGLALQIEKAMEADQTLGGTALISYLAGTETAIDATAQRPVGAVRLSYAVQYHTPAGPA